MSMFDVFKKKDDEETEDLEEETARVKNRSGRLQSITDTEKDEADTLTGQAHSRFSTDYRSYLQKQAADAQERLRKMTAAAQASIRPQPAAPVPSPAPSVPAASAADRTAEETDLDADDAPDIDEQDTGETAGKGFREPAPKSFHMSKSSEEDEEDSDYDDDVDFSPDDD